MELQPYRIPLQPSDVIRCNDRSACPPPRPNVIGGRQPHVLALVILSALFAGSIPAAFALGATSETRGRVEIDPGVLEREVGRTRKSIAPAAPLAPVAQLNRARDAKRAFSILADGKTHDAFALAARARTLKEAGTPLAIVFVDVDRGTRARLRAGDGMPLVLPVTNPHDGTVGGLLLGDLPPSSPLRSLGLESGDIIVSANGWQPADAAEVYDTAANEPSGQCALEILRDGMRLVLNLWWSGG